MKTMSLVIKIVLCMIVISSSLYANEGGVHEPSIRDLAWPAFNFTIFFGLLLFLTRNKIKDGFRDFHLKTKAVYEEAQQKAKVANDHYLTNKQKIDRLESEIKRTKQESVETTEKFKSEKAKETIERIEKIKEETIVKVEAEKNQLVRQLHREIVETVVDKARNKISGDGDKRGRIASRLLQMLK